MRRVETGRSAGLRTQVLAGLEAGETVINHPGDRVADGVRVTPE
jgi:HlyD family secretion protein